MTCGFADFGGGRQVNIAMAKHKSQIGVPAGDAEIQKEERMRLEDWEATLQEIVGECSLEQMTTGKILIAWRVKLEQEPTSLQPFQIDQIVREVMRRLDLNT